MSDQLRAVPDLEEAPDFDDDWDDLDEPDVQLVVEAQASFRLGVEAPPGLAAAMLADPSLVRPLPECLFVEVEVDGLLYECRVTSADFDVSVVEVERGE
jgi:hypothetical protein